MWSSPGSVFTGLPSKNEKRLFAIRQTGVENYRD
jgi:hypothetical protein